MQRRHFLTWMVAPLGATVGATGLSALSGCGFELRRGYAMAFRTIQLTGFAANSPLATELARTLEGSGVQVTESTLQALQAAQANRLPASHIELHALVDKRETLVSAKTAFGQVRTITARTSLRFVVKRSDGSILLPASDVVMARDLSYNERDALAKQDESAALNRALQSDIVGQVMRRLAAIRPDQLVAPAELTLPPAAVNASSMGEPATGPAASSTGR